MSRTPPTGSLSGMTGVVPIAPSDLVLDASVAIKWYIPKDLADEARRWMSGPVRDARAPGPSAPAAISSPLAR